MSDYRAFRQVGRILRLMRLLEDARRSYSYHDLAAHMGVGKRTIRRDLFVLSQLGAMIPIKTEPGNRAQVGPLRWP